MPPAETTRRKIKELEVMVAETIVETPDTTTLVLFTGNDRLDYKAGHFLTIDPHQFEALERFIAFLEDLKGKKEPARAYSLTSAPHEKHLAITVKEERYTTGMTKYPPLLSPLLVKRTTRGMRFTITGFTGPYTFPDDIESRTDHVVHICAGSGSVPNYSLLKHALVHLPKLRHTFLYSNKTYGDVIFRDALTKLESSSGGRLRVVHMLTRDEEPARYGPNVRSGRLTAPVLREFIADPSACIVYLCGPAVTAPERVAASARGIAPVPRFFESVLDGLQEVGVPRDRIEHETYG
jgi:3-ketosteroid 9alpha-monooxygenase subunit B